MASSDDRIPGNRAELMGTADASAAAFREGLSVLKRFERTGDVRSTLDDIAAILAHGISTSGDVLGGLRGNFIVFIRAARLMNIPAARLRLLLDEAIAKEEHDHQHPEDIGAYIDYGKA